MAHDPDSFQPEISLVADSPSDAEAAKLLVGALGLIQVEVVLSPQEAASSAHTLFWLRRRPNDPLVRAAKVFYLDGEQQHVTLNKPIRSLERTTTYVPTLLDAQTTTPNDRFLQAAFWMDQRLMKAPKPLSSADMSVWQFACSIATLLGPNNSEVWTTICGRLRANGGELDDDNGNIKIPCNDLADRFLKKLPTTIQRQIEVASRRQEITPKTFHDICHSLKNSISIMSISIHKWLRGEQGYLQQSIEILQRPEWSHEGTSFPRMTRHGFSLAYSPVTLLWLHLVSLGQQSEALKKEASIYQRSTTAIGSLTTAPLHDGSPEIPGSFSAWSLWRSLHQIPTCPNRQILLTRESYSNILHELEGYWLGVFRSFQSRQGRVFCRLLPWPARYKAALTLRFDIDRALTSTQIDSVLAIQRRHLDEPAGSWYFWANDPSMEQWKGILAKEGQEIGIHALTRSDVSPDVGITHHSAPTSTYWRGDATMVDLNDQGALYGEFLGNPVPTPRPMLLPNNQGWRERSETMYTGPGYPLEGSTSDVNLDFFDRLLGPFRRQLRLGGHAVVITHPDLNMALLDQLLRREDVQHVWITTTERIVSRLKHIQGYHKIGSRTYSNGVEIRSSSPFRDVQVSLENNVLGVNFSRVINMSSPSCYCAL